MQPPVIEPDKANHFLYGALIACAGTFFQTLSTPWHSVQPLGWQRKSSTRSPIVARVTRLTRCSRWLAGQRW